MNRKQQKIIAMLPDVLLPWYRENARDLPWRNTKEPYAVWLSEIMLQQTRVEAVKGYYDRFITALPTVRDLANAEESLLLKLWEGLGYYSRVRNLQKAAKTIMTEFDGVFPADYNRILSLSGIGAYTAGAISSICFDIPVPAVDGNVLRVLSRLCEIPETIVSPSFKKDATNALGQIYPKHSPGDFTQALMELGATVCLPNGAPLCDSCPAAGFCLAKKHSTQKKFPEKSVKKPRRKEELTVFILQYDSFIALNKRPDKGLLKGLWEFPNTCGKLEKDDAVRFLLSAGVTPKDISGSVSRGHIFTHVEWDMTGYYFTCENKSDAYVWVTRDQLEKEFALPTAFRQFADDMLLTEWD